MPSPKQTLMQNDHSRSFKVVRFAANEEPLRAYIVQYNNCGLECKGSVSHVSWSFAVSVARTASQQTYATRTSPTRVLGVNLKRTGFLVAGAQCDILLNCAIQI